MSAQERKTRDQATRRQLIVTSARALAEAEGWDAVTTRRLADRIEYSQPVLYQHFPNKDAIVQAVAVEGFGELAPVLRAGRLDGDDDLAHLNGLIRAYLDFAERNPVLYQAMFVLTVDLGFATGHSPAPVIEGFLEVLAAVTPLAAGRDPETLAEVVWSGCHGLATLSQSGRLRPAQRQERITLLATAFGACAGPT